MRATIILLSLVMLAAIECQTSALAGLIPAPGTNIVQNGDFATGDFTDWVTNDINLPLYPLTVRTAGFNPADYGHSLPRTIKAAGGAIWSPYFGDVDAGLISESGPLNRARVLSLRISPSGEGTPCWNNSA